MAGSLPFSRGLRTGSDAHISQNDERARTARENSNRPAWIPTQDKTQNYQAKNWELVRCRPTAVATLEVQLPSTQNLSRAEIAVTNLSGAGTLVRVYPTSGETVDGATSYALGKDVRIIFISTPQYRDWTVL